MCHLSSVHFRPPPPALSYSELIEKGYTVLKQRKSQIPILEVFSATSLSLVVRIQNKCYSSNPAPWSFYSPGMSFKSEQTQGKTELPKVRGVVKTEERASEFTSRGCLLRPA